MTTSQLEKRVSEVVKCSICLEDFRSPRALPCQHTFCLECLEGHCEDTQPNSTARCPLCNAEFTIPKNGPRGFPVNFAIQELIDAKLASSRDPSHPCEVCSTEQQFVPATLFCVDCTQKLCERCSLPHKKWKGGAHDVRPLETELRPDSKQAQSAVEEEVKSLSITGKLFNLIA